MLILPLTVHSFIAVYKASVGSIIETAITGLTPEQQMEVVKGLSKHLVNQGVINSKVSSFSMSIRDLVTDQSSRYSNILVSNCDVVKPRVRQAPLVSRCRNCMMNSKSFLKHGHRHLHWWRCILSRHVYPKTVYTEAVHQ